MNINKDFFDNPVIPDYILCKANQERVGVLQCTEKTIDLKFNDIDEINFKTHLYIDGEKNPYYDAVDIMKYILLPGIGFFSVTSVNIKSEGTESENKTVNAKSCECLLAQKYLENFTVNMGTVGSIDEVRFYDIRDTGRSLLHLVLEKCPDWQIGHIDASLPTMQRSFEITRQDIYSFLSDNAAKAFGCFFLFDALNHTINIYREENVGKDTDIHVSYINLLKNTDMSCSTDNIKTCLTITGSDNLTIRELNMGYDRIYNLNYYNSTEFMSSSLFEAYNRWITLRNSKLPAYSSLLSQYQHFYTQINHLEHEKMPTVTGSADWTEYGLKPLKEQLEIYEQKQALSMKAGHGNVSSKFYISEYLPIYNTIQAITAQIKVIEEQIQSLKAQQSVISGQMSEIIHSISMQNNFTGDELKELNTFIREEELNSSNYVVTDSMTDDEKLEMMNELLKFGENELAKMSVPRMTFHADLLNLFAIPEFKAFYEHFNPGNYIWVTLRDNFAIKAILLSIHINFHDITDFSVSFGNITRESGIFYTAIQNVINDTKSIASSVSCNSPYWNKAAKDTSSIGKMLDQGLIAAGKYLKNGEDSEMVIDTRGIFINTTSGQYAGTDSIYIGGGRILFTDDDWKTVSEAIGRIDIKGDPIFGVLAQAVIAGYIAGCEIVAGSIFSSDYSPDNGKGTRLNLDDGTFTFGDGKIVFDGNKLTIKDSEIDWNTVNESEKVLSRIKQNADQIVLKVDGSGKIVQVALGITPTSGTEFKVNADNISLTANDVINMMCNGEINMTGKNISITSDNFKVDSKGNVQCNNITAFSVSGNAVSQFNTAVRDTQALLTANQAIAKAEDSLNEITTTIHNLQNTIMPQINSQINELQVKVAALENKT